MLLRRIFIMALEHPGPGFRGVVGLPGGESLESLRDFVSGYGMCQHDYCLETPEQDDWSNFLEWLRPKGYYTPRGWAGDVIKECGDGDPAFSRFKELVFEYLELEKPKWFIDFNATIQPSFWNNVNGPRTKDIRFNKHIALLNEKPNK